MNRPGLTFPILLLLMLFGLTLLSPNAAQAQYRILQPTVYNTEGEPTDPEEAVVILESADVDVEFDTTVPGDSDEAQTWFEALLNLLRELGLLPEAGEESGS